MKDVIISGRFFVLFCFEHSFIYLAALGLICGTRGL